MADFSNMFNPMEIDAIGEILNISLGSSATAVSNMVDRRVNITTPTVEIVAMDDFEYKSLEPAVGVEITYTHGLEGSNIMLLKRADVKIIVELLMSMEIPDEEFELNDMNISAVSEVMNQMMGASSTAMAEFLGEPVDISPPVSFEVTDEKEFKAKYFSPDEPMVVVRFNLTIEDRMESEFLYVMAPKLAKRMISSFGLSGQDVPKNQPSAAETVVSQPVPAASESSNAVLSEEQIAALMSSANAVPAPAPAQAPPAAPPSPPAPAPQAYRAPAFDQRVISSAPPPAPPQYVNLSKLDDAQSGNLDLLMGVPLQLSVEIGRTRKPLKEVLEFASDTLVVLDKLAGDTVDLLVNGQCVAKGDVVVIDDYFGVRVTEIVKNPEFLLKKQ